MFLVSGLHCYPNIIHQFDDPNNTKMMFQEYLQQYSLYFESIYVSKIHCCKQLQLITYGQAIIIPQFNDIPP
jgi:hypothetical protein